MYDKLFYKIYQNDNQKFNIDIYELTTKLDYLYKNLIKYR